MDIQRAIDFILEQHSRTVTLVHDIALRQDKAEKRAEKAEKRMNRFDRQLRMCARLGLQWKRELDERMNALAVSQDRLTAAQERTEKSLKAFIDSTRKGRNGR